uniref:CHECKPOINT SERINE/THREONINE-PROTEIN KINASE BUB1 n=1 Tax=Saccharomyces cerevisiae TaxID=4932 RepID=UPI0003994F60|nr:Chain B, Checkpoint Serine/threonine-protein Kinase Bub1 [Saccharomyces cerevisiae]4BL0_E Chain E, Checkpoint Serine/threonine-protein Kinase Bub1 [Saccharomyces cerevisiae]
PLGSNKKTSIYADQKQSNNPVYKLINTPGRKPERIVFNFNLIYPENDEEFNTEEILAMIKGLYKVQRRGKKHTED